MAIICCPECGKEISDKATSCPHCGLPLSQNNQLVQEGSQLIKESPDAINQFQSPIVEDCIGCPKCGSTELHAEKQGFSGKKALVGAVLTGGIGLLAGTIGSKNVNITCMKCGNKFKAGEGKTVKKVTFPTSFIMDEKVLDRLKEGSKLAAAIEYGEIHKVEMADAQGIVDAYIKSHPSVFKENKPEEEQNNAGCAATIVILAIVGACLAFAFL